MLPEKLELKIHLKRWAKLLGARVDLRPRNGRGLTAVRSQFSTALTSACQAHSGSPPRVMLRLVLLRGLDLREPSFAVANKNEK